MSIERLVGGIFPANGEDPRTFPLIWNDAAQQIETAQGSIVSLSGRVTTTETNISSLGGRVTTAENEIANLQGDVADLEGGVVGGTAVYRFVDTVYYTSNGTFDKADYSWLRAIRVKVQGAGGGGAGATTTTATETLPASGASGGAYAESFITDIAGLSSPVTVTVGAGGTGGTWSLFTRGGTGGISSFGSAVSANGALGGVHQNPLGGTYVTPAEDGPVTATGDLTIPGSASGLSVGVQGSIVVGGNGGGSHLGAGRAGPAIFGSAGANGQNGRVFGGGGTGAAQGTDQATARTGGTGAGGIVIVELYA
jgi:hypothetical protein